MSARTMALKYATRNCPLNKVPNTRRGSRLDPGFNYVNLTDAQLHEIRIRKGYGISNKQRYANLRLGRCIEKNTQRGQFVKRTHETWGGGRRIERENARFATPQSQQVPAPDIREVEIREGGLKGREFGLAFFPTTYKTPEDSQVGCKPSNYITSGRGSARNIVKQNADRGSTEYAKNKGGQLKGSSRPPVTVTKCIGFGRRKKKKAAPKEETSDETSDETSEALECNDLIGSGSGPPGGGTGVDPCAEQDAAAGLGDTFAGVGSDSTIYNSLEAANAALGGHSESGVPQQTFVRLPGKLIIPTATKCNPEQRRIDLENSIALAAAGFVGTGLGESGQQASNDFVSPF